MNRMKIYMIAVSLCLSSLASAQGEWHWQSGPFIGDTASKGALLHASFEYQMGSTALNNAILNDAIFGSELTAERALENTDRMDKDRGRVGGFAEGELWFRSGGEKWRFIAGAGFRELFGASLSTDLMRLYLRGNGPYEDETLDLSDGTMFNTSHQFIGLGAEVSASEKLTLGLTANLQKIGRYQRLDLQNANLYTAPFGEYVESDLAMTYETAGTSEPKLSAWYGTGLTASGYLNWKVSEKSSVHVKVKDLGVMMFQGINTYTIDTSYLYEGVEISSILQLDDSIFADGDLDSLEAVLGLTSSNGSQNALSPGYFEFGFSTELTPNVGFRLSLRQWWRAGAFTQVSASVPIALGAKLQLEPGITFGGWANSVASLGVLWCPTQRLGIRLQAAQFQNLVASASSSGQSLGVGFSLGF